jgi:hypothetical protein
MAKYYPMRELNRSGNTMAANLFNIIGRLQGMNG